MIFLYVLVDMVWRRLGWRVLKILYVFISSSGGVFKSLSYSFNKLLIFLTVYLFFYRNFLIFWRAFYMRFLGSERRFRIYVLKRDQVLGCLSILRIIHSFWDFSRNSIVAYVIRSFLDHALGFFLKIIFH